MTRPETAGQGDRVKRNGPPETPELTLNISAKTEYACIAIVELAAHFGSGEPVRIGTIAEKHGIPKRFLVQILLQLKGAGLVASSRGATGGYRLVRDPREVTLQEVMQVIEGPEQPPSCSASRESWITRTLSEVWQEVHRQQLEMLDNVTLADLNDRAEAADSMYYI